MVVRFRSVGIKRRKVETAILNRVALLIAKVFTVVFLEFGYILIAGDIILYLSYIRIVIIQEVYEE